MSAAQTLHGIRSFDPNDYPEVSNKIEEWKYSPIEKLQRVLTGENGYDIAVQVDDTFQVTLEELGGSNTPKRFIPRDRLSSVILQKTQVAQKIVIPEAFQSDDTIHIAVTSTDIAYGHLVIEFEKHSSVNVCVTFAGNAEAAINVEYILQHGSNVKIVELLEQKGSLFGERQIYIGKDATCNHLATSLQTDIVRVSPYVMFDDSGGDVSLQGLMLAGNGQHHEFRVFVDHQTPHCTSNVVYKAISFGEGTRTAWVGDVFVGKNAKNINTYEENRNLLLDNGPRADSVPNLELETGEIQGAGHASSTGKLDENHLFYLMSRGISSTDTRRLIIVGFFNELFNSFGDDGITKQVLEYVEQQIQHQYSIE